MLNIVRKIILFPFAILYALAVNVRNFLYDKGIMRGVEFDLPIINVGNLSAGGNGKTPHVEYIIRLLSQKYSVAVLSRGYGRKSKGFHEVKVSDSASHSGDEPLQIKQDFEDQVRVFVGEDRVEALTQMLFLYPDIDVVVLDDAFQHRALKPGLNLLLSDHAHPFFQDWFLPVGRLRESKSGARRADAIILTKVEENASNLNEYKNAAAKYCPQVFASTLAYGEIKKWDNGTTLNKKQKVFLVTGIANPKTMEAFVRENYQLLGSMHFSDHHKFHLSDLKKIAEKLSIFAPEKPVLLTTVKDAVRFKEVLEKYQEFDFDMYVLPVQPKFIQEDEDSFNQLIFNYVRESSGNS